MQQRKCPGKPSTQSCVQQHTAYINRHQAGTAHAGSSTCNVKMPLPGYAHVLPGYCQKADPTKDAAVAKAAAEQKPGHQSGC